MKRLQTIAFILVITLFCVMVNVIAQDKEKSKEKDETITLSPESSKSLLTAVETVGNKQLVARIAQLEAQLADQESKVVLLEALLKAKGVDLADLDLQQLKRSDTGEIRIPLKPKIAITKKEKPDVKSTGNTD